MATGRLPQKPQIPAGIWREQGGILRLSAKHISLRGEGHGSCVPQSRQGKLDCGRHSACSALLTQANEQTMMSPIAGGRLMGLEKASSAGSAR